MVEREITFTLPEELYRALEQQQDDGNLEAFVRRVVIEKLAASGSPGPASRKERVTTPLLEKFTQGLKGKDIDCLIREARAESESRIIGQGVAYLALFISEVMMEAITAPVTEAGRTFLPPSLSTARSSAHPSTP